MDHCVYKSQLLNKLVLCHVTNLPWQERAEELNKPLLTKDSDRLNLKRLRQESVLFVHEATVLY